MKHALHLTIPMCIPLPVKGKPLGLYLMVSYGVRSQPLHFPNVSQCTLQRVISALTTALVFNDIYYDILNRSYPLKGDGMYNIYLVFELKGTKAALLMEYLKENVNLIIADYQQLLQVKV